MVTNAPKFHILAQGRSKGVLQRFHEAPQTSLSSPPYIHSCQDCTDVGFWELRTAEPLFSVTHSSPQVYILEEDYNKVLTWALVKNIPSGFRCGVQ
jgi:hypothetical protein